MLRLLLGILLFLISLLTVVNAPTHHLWLLAILVTEFPVAFILAACFLLLSPFRFKKHQAGVALLAAISLILFFIPIINAYRISRNVDSKIDKALAISTPAEAGRANFFDPLKLFGLNRQREVAFKTLVYKSEEKSSLSLDFYASKVEGKRPVIIVIHGGSWSSGSSQQLPELNSVLSEAGYHVASINYRKAPDYKNPAAVEDAVSAMDFLKREATTLQIDSNNFVLLGRSAGAQIALLTAYSQKINSIKGVIDFYGPADMVWGYSVPANPLVLNSRKVMEDYLGGTYKQVPQKYFASSPIEYVNSYTVPTLIIHGQKDALVSYQHSVRLEKKLSNHKVPHFLLSLPWATHGFDFTLNGPGGQLSTHCVLRFLEYIAQKKQIVQN